MSDLPTVKDIRRLLYSIRRKWYHIGIELDVDIEVLDTIRDTYSDLNDCLTEMIKKLKKSNKLNLTWKALADALRAEPVDEVELALKADEKQLQCTTLQMDPVTETYQDSSSTGDLRDHIDETYQYPLLKVLNLTVEEKEQLTIQLNADSRTICYTFAGLVAGVTARLKESNITAEDMKTFFAHCEYEELSDAINTNDSIPAVMTEVKKRGYWSFFNYELLESVIRHYCMKLIPSLEDYQSKFKEYCRRRVKEVPVGILKGGEPTNPQSSTKFYVKLDDTFSISKSSMISVKEVGYKIQKILNVKKPLQLMDVQSGCILLTLRYFGKSSTLFPLDEEQKSSLAEVGVCRIYCGEYEVKLKNGPHLDCEEAVPPMSAPMHDHTPPQQPPSSALGTTASAPTHDHTPPQQSSSAPGTTASATHDHTSPQQPSSAPGTTASAPTHDHTSPQQPSSAPGTTASAPTHDHIINEFNCSIDEKGHKGRSLLHRACMAGNVQLVRSLILDYKADVNARNNTPLHMARAPVTTVSAPKHNQTLPQQPSSAPVTTASAPMHDHTPLRWPPRPVITAIASTPHDHTPLRWLPRPVITASAPTHDYVMITVSVPTHDHAPPQQPPSNAASKYNHTPPQQPSSSAPESAYKKNFSYYPCWILGPPEVTDCSFSDSLNNRTKSVQRGGTSWHSSSGPPKSMGGTFLGYKRNPEGVGGVLDPKQLQGYGHFWTDYRATPNKEKDTLHFPHVHESQPRTTSVLQTISHPKDQIIVILTGKSGAGKSTLMNSVFRVAEKERSAALTHLHHVPSRLISVYDKPISKVHACLPQTLQQYLQYLFDIKLHHDLKPESILPSGAPHVLIADFGCSRMIRENLNAGTRAYLGSLDVWSFGVTLYEMLRSTIPFNEDEETADQNHDGYTSVYHPDPWRSMSSDAVNFIHGSLRKSRFQTSQDALESSQSSLEADAVTHLNWKTTVNFISSDASVEIDTGSFCELDKQPG